MEFRSEAKKTSRISGIRKEEAQKSLSSLRLSSRNDQKKKGTKKFRAWTIWISKNPPPRLNEILDLCRVWTACRSIRISGPPPLLPKPLPPDSPQASVLKLESSVASSPKPATTPGGGRKSKKRTVCHKCLAYTPSKIFHLARE